MNPQAFLDLMVPAAQACHARTGIPASFTLAQAALESSWGRATPGFNLFGIFSAITGLIAAVLWYFASSAEVAHDPNREGDKSAVEFFNGEHKWDVIRTAEIQTKWNKRAALLRVPQRFRRRFPCFYPEDKTRRRLVTKSAPKMLTSRRRSHSFHERLRVFLSTFGSQRPYSCHVQPSFMPPSPQ